MSLIGKTAFVTSAAGGFSAAIVRRLGAASAAIAFADMSLEGAHQVARENIGNGGQGHVASVPTPVCLKMITA